MKGALLLILAGIGTTIVSGWEVDARCLRRKLEMGDKQALQPEDVFEDENENESNIEANADEGQDEELFDPEDFMLQDAAVLDFASNESDSFAGMPIVDGFEEQAMLRGSSQQRHLQQEDYQLKMYWEQGYCWQEEWRERWWCMECQGSCTSGNPLWLQRCRDKPEQRFYFVRSGDGHQLRKSGTNLCLDRVQNNRYELRPCDSSDLRQIFWGFNRKQPFELFARGDTHRCINQHHHPKATEIVETTICRIARFWHTNLWEVYNPSQGSGGGDGGDGSSGVGGNLPVASLRNPECSDRRPCNVCQGDCDSDRQCRGNLKCFQRQGSRTGSLPVPGCRGNLVNNRDYCYDPAAVSGGNYNNNNGNDIGIKTPVRMCSSSAPCGLCEGDCDRNSDCSGNLVCHQKNGAGYVPGCGVEQSRTDFCVKP